MIMKKVSLLKPLLLLFALIVGSSSAWATDVTRTENFASSSAASNQYACSSNATTSGMQDDWDYAWTPSGSVYVFQSGIRLGKSGGTGTVTNTTMLSGIPTGTSVTIKVYAAVWNADGGSLVVTYNGSSQTKDPANSAITDTSKEYSSSDFSSSTNFTITKAEGITSFSIASSTKRIFVDKVEVIYDDGPAKSPNGLAWSATSKDVTYSETPYNLPTLTNPHSLAVTYDSSDKSVATIDSEGNVTIKNKTGNTTISASTEGDATYAAGTVSYTLNVTSKTVLEDGVFNFGFGEDYGSGVTQDGTIVEGSTSTWTSGNIVMTVANRYAWYADGTLRVYKKTSTQEASVLTITCPAGKAITQIEFTGPYTSTGALSNIDSNIGTYTVTSSSAIWTGAAQSVSFTASASTYINTITVTYGANATITPAKEYTTYVTYVAMDFTGVSGLKAFVATAADGTGVTLTEPAAAVPANTPLVLKKVSGTSFEVPVVASGTAPATNLLKAGPATLTGDGTEYILKDSKFYKASAGSLATGKAYLKTASALGRDLDINWGDETGINALENATKIDNGAIYDLSGRRVENPTKGIYIINGKKVVVR